MQAQAGSEDQPIPFPDMDTPDVETAPPPPPPIIILDMDTATPSTTPIIGPDRDTVHVDKVEVPDMDTATPPPPITDKSFCRPLGHHTRQTDTENAYAVCL